MAWHTEPGPPLEEHEDAIALKVEFAGYMARGKSAREAAYTVFRFDTDAAGQRYFGRAMQATAWESDPFVQEEIERFRSPTEVTSLHPTEDQVDLEILDAARSATSASDKAKLYELYLNARGRNTKGAGTTVNVDNRKQTMHVLSVPAKMTVEQAQAAFLARQGMKTIEHASSRPN